MTQERHTFSDVQWQRIEPSMPPLQRPPRRGVQGVFRCSAVDGPRVLDAHHYKARHLVENLFQRMKVFRRIATRYDKLDDTFLGFAHIAGIMKWLH